MALLAALVALVRVGSTIPAFTNIVDEPYHIASAVALWDVRKHTLGVEHPPLPRLLAGLPLYLSGVRLPADARDATVRSEPQTQELAGRILFESSLSYRQILHRARLAMLVFAATALLYLYLLTRWAGGDVAAMCAVVFFSLDPTLLGHAMWVTTDAAACAGFLAASYHGLRWIEHATLGRMLSAGAALGLAVSCKFTCVLVVPGLALVLVFNLVRARWKERRSGRVSSIDDPPVVHRAAGQVWPQLATIGLVAFGVLWATYLFDFGPMRNQTVFSPQSQWARMPAWVKETPVPMPSLPLGVLQLLAHNRWGHPSYLNGEIDRYRRWAYFPEAIALKSPLALLMAAALGMAVFLWTRGRALRQTGEVLVVAGIALALAMTGNLNIGIRHVLPVIPALYLLASTALLRAGAALILVALLGLAAVETAFIHPDYVAFFNVAAGGPQRGEKFLLDSNLDWGQDLGRLAAWLRSEEAAHRPYTMRVFAHPQDRVVAQLGLDPSALALPPSGLFAISKNIRHGISGAKMLPEGGIQLTEDYDWLSHYPVVKRIGQSIDVYDLAGEQPQRLVSGNH